MIANVIQPRQTRFLIVVLALAVSAEPLAAHDLERTAVSLTFARDGSFVLEVANDPNWLLLRLESFLETAPGPSDGVSSAPGPTGPGPRAVPIFGPADRDARLRTLAPVFVDRIVLFVDGKEVRPRSIEYVPPFDSRLNPALAQGTPGMQPADIVPPRLAAFRLRGRVDPDAHILRWYYGMVVDPYPLTIHRADGRVVNEWIVAGDAWSRVEDLTGQFERPTFLGVARQYIALGYARVIPNGLDHILFIVAVFLFGLRPRFVLLQMLTFSVACATALAITAYNIVSAPPRGFGVFVALSVVYIAADNLAGTPLKRVRLAFVSACGLLHGIALASPLTNAAPASRELPLAILWFYLGITGAELTIIAVAAACVTWSRAQSWYHCRVVVPASVAIVGMGVYWTITRVIGS
jgi:HupE/UreJ protein